MKKWVYTIADEYSFILFESRRITIIPKKAISEPDDLDIKQIKDKASSDRRILVLSKVPFLQSGKLNVTLDYVTAILNKYPDIAKQYIDNLYKIREADSYDVLKQVYDWYLNTAIRLLEKERPDLYEMYVNYEIKADKRTGILDSNHAYVLRAVVFLAKFMVVPLMYWPDCLSDTNCPVLDVKPEIVKEYTYRLFGRHDNLYNNILLLIKAIARGRFSGIFEKLEAMNKKSAAEEEAYTLYHLMYSALLQLSEDAQSLGTVTRIIQSKYLVTVRESAQYNIKPVESINTPMSLRLPNIITISHNLREAVITQTYLLSLVKQIKRYVPKQMTYPIRLSNDWFIEYAILPAFYKAKHVRSAPSYILTEEMLAAIRMYVLDQKLVPDALAKYLYMVQMQKPIQVAFTDIQQAKKNRFILRKYLDVIRKQNTFVYTVKDNKKVYLITRNGLITDIPLQKILKANGLLKDFESLIDLIPPELEDTLIPFVIERTIELVYGHVIDMTTGQKLNTNKQDLIKSYYKFLVQHFELEPLFTKSIV